MLAYEVAKQLGTRFVFVEKESGVPALRRGFAVDREDRVLVVEDVVTTGLSVREVIDVVRNAGAEIAGIGIAIAREDISSFGNCFALLDMPLVSYDQSECPQCKEGIPIADPGSRRT